MLSTPLVRLLGAAGCFAALASWAAVAERGTQGPSPRKVQLRRPVAAAFLADGRTVCVANQRSGTVSLVDVAAARIVGETAVGQHLTDLAVLPDGKHVLVVDDQRHELIALSCDGTNLTVRARLPVGPYPISVGVQPDGRRAIVASLWSRRVEVVDLTPLSSPTPSVTLRVLHMVRLPFAPRNQCMLPGGPCVVADAFGGHLAVVDAGAGRLSAVHPLAGHNIRGLALSADGKHLWLSQQLLDQQAPTTRETVERGVLMGNLLRELPMDALLSPQANLDKAGRMIRLGEVKAGAGDPAGVAVVDAGQIAVALAGVNEAALVRTDGKPTWRIAVGRRPTAVIARGPGQPLVIVNTFDDSLSVLDPQRDEAPRTIALGPQPPLSYAERGELLFFDARLGRDGWLSCHSCHTDGHTNGLLADTLGDGTFGTPKRTLTLLNTRMTDPWGWNGSMQYLHDQVEKSLVETMHSPAASAEHIADLVSFLHTLPPPPPLEPATTEATDRAQLERGRRLFQDRGCVRCHIPPLTYSSHEAYNVGFADERGLNKFNPPSLRGVGHGQRFLHDNRAASLEEVFTKFRHKVGSGLSTAELADLLRFLRSL